VSFCTKRKQKIIFIRDIIGDSPKKQKKSGFLADFVSIWKVLEIHRIKLAIGVSFGKIAEEV
jgi:hypothetical protein